MKLLLVIPVSMFDACLPLIQQLNILVELHCLFIVPTYTNNLMELSVEDVPMLSIVKANKVNKLNIYKNYIPLEKSTILSTSKLNDIKGLIWSQKQANIYISNLSPDFIYFYNNPSNIFLPFIYKTKIKWGVAVHDPILHTSQKNRWYYYIIRKLIYIRCKCFFLFTNNLVEEFVKEYNINPDYVHLTMLGPYEQLNLYAKKTLPKKHKLNILFFGRIERYKGLRYLLEAYKRIKNKSFNFDIELRIVGRGYIENDIIDLNDTEGLIIHNEFATVEQLVESIQMCDIIICPYTDATQSGVIMSAYALRKPAIVTNVGGLTEMVIDNETGMIIPPFDVDAIVNSIIYVYENQNLLEKWSNNIDQIYYKGERSWKNIAHKLLKDINYEYNN